MDAFKKWIMANRIDGAGKPRKIALATADGIGPVFYALADGKAYQKALEAAPGADVLLYSDHGSGYDALVREPGNLVKLHSIHTRTSSAYDAVQAGLRYRRIMIESMRKRAGVS